MSAGDLLSLINRFVREAEAAKKFVIVTAGGFGSGYLEKTFFDQGSLVLAFRPPGIARQTPCEIRFPENLDAPLVLCQSHKISGCASDGVPFQLSVV